MRDEFPTTAAMLDACARQVAVAHGALTLLTLMDHAGNHGAEHAFDEDIAQMRATCDDVIGARCELLGKAAHEAGFAIGAELRALGRQLNIDWCSRHEAAVRTQLLAAE